MGLCSLSEATISRGYTGCAPSIRIRAVSMVMSTPVRPIPALKKAYAHSYLLKHVNLMSQVQKNRHDSRKCFKTKNVENEKCMQQVIFSC